jgi:hypothetical protein
MELLMGKLFHKDCSSHLSPEKQAIQGDGILSQLLWNVLAPLLNNF